MSIALALSVLWGFGPTYFLRSFITTRELSPIIHIHATFFIAWIALMLVQTTLVATRRTYVHRRLGLVSMAVAAGVLVTGMLVPFLATSVRWHAWQSLSSFPARADAVVVSCTVRCCLPAS